MLGIFAEAEVIREAKIKKSESVLKYIERDEVEIIRSKLLKKYMGMVASISI
jgi:hypothetical protein